MLNKIVAKELIASLVTAVAKVAVPEEETEEAEA